MNQPSEFQKQYPLAGRKFWKKLLWIFWPALWIFIVPPSIAGFVSTLTVLMAVSLVLYIIQIVLYGIYVRAYISRYYYDVGDNFVTIQKGVFAPTEIHIQYQKVQDVYVDQDIWDRLMGLYDVHIASATLTSGIEAHIDGVDSATAERLKRLLLDKITGQGPNNIPITPIMTSPATLPTGEVSINTYPFSHSWFVSNFVGSSVMSIFLTIFMSPLTSLIPSFFLAGKISSGYIELIWFFIVYLFFYIINLVMGFVWKRNFMFKLTPEYLFLHSGVIGIQEKNIPYSTIQNVMVFQNFTDRIFGMANVVVENAAGGQDDFSNKVMIPWQPLGQANKLAEILRDMTVKKQSSRTGL